MSNPFLGEIRIFGGNFAPRGWALCNGQLMAISQNTALFSLLGTNYGGDGTSTFGLPNFQGNAPLHAGQGAGLSSYVVGETAGTATQTLTTAQITSHNHSLIADSAAASETGPGGNLFGKASLRSVHLYGPSTSPTTMASATLGPNSGNQPHANQQPYLALNFIIATQGIYPSRS